MNEFEVFKLIVDQLNGRTQSASGWNFKAFLVQPPERAIFKSSNGIAWPLWVVLREAENGYVVGYDDEDKSFQLVASGTVIAEYETLLAAINGL